MAIANLDPLIRDNKISVDIEIEDGTNIILHELFLEDITTIVFVEQNATLYFV